MNKKTKKFLMTNAPFFIVGALGTNLGEAWRFASGSNASEKIASLFVDGSLIKAFKVPLPSLYLTDILIGALIGGGLWLFMYFKKKNAKKFRHNIEFGSARWGTPKDIENYMDQDDPDNNIILTQTECVRLKGKPKNP